MNIPLMPEQASSFGAEVDALFFALVGLALFFSLAVGFAVIFFAIRFRRSARVNRRGATDHHTGLEIAWSVPPLLLGLAMFMWNAKVFAHFKRPPENALNIFVIGKQWMWHIQHENGVRENNELHIPLGRPVKLTMISQDVIHGFFIPEFRTKMDVIPGRYTTQWFEPTKLGEYRIFCTQYCGTNHSEMTGRVYVVTPAEYQEWLAKGGTSAKKPALSLAEAGGELYRKLACDNCHQTQSTPRAPTLIGIYGSKTKLKDGRMITVDDAYLRESLINPYAKLTYGYEKTMPEYKLPEEQILQLNAYIKSLRTAADLKPANAEAVKPNKSIPATGR
jgi:cytochrome c oxidase subunit 2